MSDAENRGMKLPSADLEELFDQFNKVFILEPN